MKRLFKNVIAFLGIGILGFSFAYAGSGDTTVTHSMANTSIVSKDAFSLKLVTPISFSQVELIFSHNMSQKSDDNREFRVVNKKDSLDELGVIKTQLDALDHTKLVLTFDKTASAGAEYEITVVDLKDENGVNIESGIDGISSFVFPKSFQANSESITSKVLTQTGDISTASQQDTGVVLNSALSDTVSGVNIDESQVAQNAISEAKKTEKLPKTGPQEMVILLLSIFLTAILFIYKFKKA